MTRDPGSIASAVVACAVAAWMYAAAATGLPDVERGQALYENHCVACHGRNVHGRTGKPPLTHAELAHIVRQWADAEGLPWSGQDVDDVVAYLQRVVYRGMHTGAR